MNAASLQGALRSLPQVEEVLNSPTVRAAAEGAPRALAVEAVRASIEQARSAILDGSADAADVSAIEAAATAAIRKAQAPSLHRVVNATGVVVHTNLGRSVLAPSAVKAAARVAGGYSTLEYDAETLTRGSRHAHCERLLRMLTGAEDAIAVNNNAAAVLLVLSCFGRGRQAVVSRGELVEIGGSFRIPDIMELSGAQMVEVGTTNKTHPSDYESALGAQTGLLVKVHPSNFRMEGFTESVGVKELAALAQRENAERRELDPACDPVLVYEDQGSGALLPLDVFGEGDEPTPAESLKAGCDLVSFSGDKLLGGPQAGIIAGSAKLIAQLKAHPLARALRLDKMTLAALEETLRL